MRMVLWKHTVECGVGAVFRLTRKVVGHGVMLGVVLELLGCHGGAEEVLKVLEDIFFGRRERARLGVRIELSHRDAASTFSFVGVCSF